MAKKPVTMFECAECGHESSRWLGRCPACNSWNSFKEKKEVRMPAVMKSRHPDTDPQVQAVMPMGEIDLKDAERIPSGFAEFDRVLGGGLVCGGSVLLGGEPGIGKSTLVSHCAASVAARGKGPVLYANGEEAAAQVKMRWKRLGLHENDVHVVASGHMDLVRDAITTLKPCLVLIDSVQTLFDPAFDSPPGSIQQTKFCVYMLAEMCRQLGAALVFVAHVTKEGSIAGPKVLEHMVDTVLYFEASERELRFLRAQKNRFGASDELGIFTMDETGLHEVKDPAMLFVEQRSGAVPPGIVAAPVHEGSRVYLVELQALTVPGKAGLARTYSEKIDQRRISRLSAVLEKHAGIRFSDQDIYVHVAGGMRIQDTGSDLALALALHSARTGIPVPGGIAVFGELSLAGEVRSVSKLRKRAQAALDLGMKRLCGPATGEEMPAAYTVVRTISEAVKVVFGNAGTGSAGNQQRGGNEVADNATKT